ncbi:hypothetical protein V6N12_003522 [Hibiscus sabdariffa]|uniref:Uncharacterized protein n=1 Tax=Hibiscus sabdariffa TaxID=183260 RepID=A0ABR2ARE9_9ROSI
MAHQRLRAVGDQGQAQVLVSLQKVVALTHASLSISSDASPWREIAVVWEREISDMKPAKLAYDQWRTLGALAKIKIKTVRQDS